MRMIAAMTMLVITSACGGESPRYGESDEKPRRVVARTIASANSAEDPCDGARDLRQFLDARATSRLGAGGYDSIGRPAEVAWQDRRTRCCTRRVAHVRAEIASLNENGPPQGTSRSEMLGAIRAAATQVETQMPVMEACGGHSTLERLQSAAQIENGVEHAAPDRWRSYVEVLDLDAHEGDLATLLFPASRRQELATGCLRGGRAAAQAAARRGNLEQAVSFYQDLLRCMSNVPVGVEVADREAVSAERELAALQSRLAAQRRREEELRRRQRGQQAERDRARATSGARGCMNDCMRQGESAWDCSAHCARRHPGAAAQ